MKVALYVGGAALLLIAGYAVYSMTQTKQTQAAAPAPTSNAGATNASQTSGSDHTAQDWATAVDTGTKVINTASSLLDRWL